MQSEPILVMSDEFSKEYLFYEKHEDTVIHKDTKQIFRATYKHGMMHLFPISNQTAMEKLEKGLANIALKLKKI